MELQNGPGGKLTAKQFSKTDKSREMTGQNKKCTTV